MECNEQEARRAMDIAQRKLLENDFYGARKLINKAQNLYPKLDGLKHVLMITDVYISASNGGGREANWYGILGLNRLADDETVKKQYKKLALLLHPDKNNFSGAEGAFKLVSEAWFQLSNQERKQKKSGIHEPASSTKPRPEPPERNPNPKPKPNPQPEPKPIIEPTFWTVCNRCKTYCEFLRAHYLYKTMSCPNCGQGFVAAEIVPEIINGRPAIRMSPSALSISKRASDTCSSAHKRVKRWFEPKLESDSLSGKEKVTSTFWTVCNRCKTYRRFVRANYLNKTLPCQNCGQDFIANEIIPEVVNGSPVIRLATYFQPTRRTGTNASSSTSSSSSAKAANQTQEGVKKWFEE